MRSALIGVGQSGMGDPFGQERSSRGQVLAQNLGLAFLFALPSFLSTMLAFELAYAQPAISILAADISSRFAPDYSAEAGFVFQPIGNVQQIAMEVGREIRMETSPLQPTPPVSGGESEQSPTPEPTNTPKPQPTATPSSTPTPTPTLTPIVVLPTVVPTIPKPTPITPTPTAIITPDKVTVSQAHYHRSTNILHIEAESNTSGCIVTLVYPPYTEGAISLKFEELWLPKPEEITVISSCGGKDSQEVKERN